MATRPHTRTTTQRGYGTTYQRERARWKQRVDAGTVTCWRCGTWINSALPWHLGHDDHDRAVIRGPEHPRCNLGAAARKTNAIRRARHATPPRPTRQVINSRRW